MERRIGSKRLREIQNGSTKTYKTQEIKEMITAALIDNQHFLKNPLPVQYTFSSIDCLEILFNDLKSIKKLDINDREKSC